MTAPRSRAGLLALVAERAAAADRTGSVEDLEAAEEAARALLDVLADDDLIRPRTAATLGSVWRRQWLIGRRPDGLDAAIELYRQVTATAAPDQPMCLANLGNALLTRGGPEDLDEAVEAFAEAVKATATGEPSRVPYLMNLGAALVARARQRPATDDLDRGISVLNAALTAAADDDPRLPAYRANVADALRTRFHRTFQLPDINLAVELARQAFAQEPTAAVNAVLGGALLDRSRTTGDAEDLAAALHHLATALQATPPQHAFRGRRMAGLAAGLRQRADTTGDPADLVRAEALLVAAARLTPVRSVLVNLAAVVIRRATVTGDRTLLDRGVELARGVDRTNLATALHLRASRTGDLDELDEAVRIAEEVVADAAAGTPEHVGAVANLAAILQTRFLRTGRGTDLDVAVAAARGGADSTPEGDPERAGRFSNLGNLLRMRGVRLRSPADLDEAVLILRGAAASARSDRAGHLSNLGAALQSRAEFGFGAPGEAVPVLCEALTSTAPGSPHRPRYLSNLGNALVTDGDPATAVDLQREALAELPDRHPDRPVVLGNLAMALLATGEDARVAEATEATREVVDDPTASGQDRLLAAWRLADLQVGAAGGDASAAAATMRVALELAERVAWIGSAPTDRPYTLSRFSSLPMDAAAAVVATDPTAAVAALEAGRGVGWRDRLQQRTLDALAETAPELAARLRAVGTALDSPAST